MRQQPVAPPAAPPDARGTPGSRDGAAYDALYNLRFYNGTPTLVTTLHRWRASPAVARAICSTVYETKPGVAFKQTLCEDGMVPALVSAARCHVGRSSLFLLLARTLRSLAETCARPTTSAPPVPGAASHTPVLQPASTPVSSAAEAVPSSATL